MLSRISGLLFHFIDKQNTVEVVDFVLKDDGGEVSEVEFDAAAMAIDGADSDALVAVDKAVDTGNTETAFFAFDHRLGHLRDLWIDVALDLVVDVYDDRANVTTDLWRGNSNPVLHEHCLREGVEIGLEFRGRDLFCINLDGAFA